MNMPKIDLRLGDCLGHLKDLPDNSVDSIVTDPPYGLSNQNSGDITNMLECWLNGKPYHHGKAGLCGAAWDAFVPGPEVWRECLRVLKPGGHLVCFAGTRTQHLMGLSIQLAGFEIRDLLGFIHGSGFPKSLNIGKSDKEFEGWGSQLKPAIEPITLARKPLCGTLVENMRRWGVGGIHVDGCRVGYEGEAMWKPTNTTRRDNCISLAISGGREPSTLGRFPPNILTDGSPEVVGEFPITAPAKKADMTKPRTGKRSSFLYSMKSFACATHSDNGGSAARYFPAFTADDDLNLHAARKVFYCAKASPKDRNEGTTKNVHPTVKNSALMSWLVKLVTPENGLCLDPFMGSGSTGKGCALAGQSINFMGFELSSEFYGIAKDRVEYAYLKAYPADEVVNG